MYKNVIFLSVKFIIIVKHIHYQNAFLQKTLRKGGVTVSITASLEIYILQLRSEKFYRDFPPQKKRKTIRQQETAPAAQSSCPVGNPSSLCTWDVGK